MGNSGRLSRKPVKPKIHIPVKIARMRLKKNIATSEEGFIFNPGTGDSFTTNDIGTDIIALLKEEKPHEMIIETICAKYDVDQNLFEKDLDDYLSQLKDYTILE